MSGAIAIFVKTPGLSPVKTRLAVKLGQNMAESFHLASANAVAEVIQKTCESRDIQGYFAVAEASALSHDYWQTMPCIWQGEGGLGERMQHIYQGLLAKHDYVILVGADIPQMTVLDLQQAASDLTDKTHPVIAFAPSDDGGFWLLGGNCPIPEAIWSDVVYSQADTGQCFLDKVKPLAEIKVLKTLVDVDEPEHLLALDQQLSDLSEILPAQEKLRVFLQTVN